MSEYERHEEQHNGNGQSAGLGFDLADLKLSQDFDTLAGVKKMITHIPVRKPDRQWFFRVHPDPAYQIAVGCLELKAEREIYVVHPRLHSELIGELKSMKLFFGITKQHVPFVWPVPLPDSEGKHNPWHQAAMEAASRAQRGWIRMAANMHLGAYDIFAPLGDLGEPEWPELDMQQIIDIAFKHYLIAELEHPVIQRLRGAI